VQAVQCAWGGAAPCSMRGVAQDGASHATLGHVLSAPSTRVVGTRDSGEPRMAGWLLWNVMRVHEVGVAHMNMTYISYMSNARSGAACWQDCV
jgi:hypothetical protein